MNGWKWTSWNDLRCQRFENTAHGKWIWKWVHAGNSWGSLFGDTAHIPNSLFPELEDIAIVTCREYANCDRFWYGNWPPKDPLISTSCDNVNGSEDNCDKLKFHCPNGLIANVEYATCERIPTTAQNVFSKWSGKWKFPEITQTHEDITCKEDNQINTPRPTSEPTSKTISDLEIKVCNDLDDHFFDETIDVSF